MKIKLILLMMAMSLIWTGCASQKKLDSGDEFSVDDSAAASGKPSDDLSLDGAAPATGGSDDLSLDEPAAKSASTPPQSDASDMDAALENELNSLDNGAAPQPVQNTASNELSLDEPSAPIAKNDPPVAPEAVAPPPEVPMTPEVPLVPEQSVTEPTAPVASGAPVTINTVQYKGNSNGGAVTIAADQPLQFTTRFNSITNQFVVEVQNSTIPKKLTRTLNTKDMASSIGSVDIYQKSGSNVARFVVQLRPGSSEPIVQPEGNALLIIGASIAGAANQSSDVIADAISTANTEDSTAPTSIGASTSLVAPTDDNSTATAKAFSEPNRRVKGGVLDYENLEDFLMGDQQFTGKKISLETSGIKVTDAINFIAEESGANIIVSQPAMDSGTISVRLRDVPWDQALVVILKTKKLVYKRLGNTLIITTLEDLKKEEQDGIALRESRQQLEPIAVKRFFISYSDLDVLKTQIEDYLKSAKINEKNQAVQSDTIGKVIVDKRTNSLIVTDRESKLKYIESFIKAVDTQPKQVQIETKIVQVAKSFARSLGVKWSAPGSAAGTNSGVISIDPTPDQASQVVGNVFDASVNWGSIDFLGSLRTTLQLAEAKGLSRSISNQSITTLNNVDAKFETTTTNKIAGATTTQVPASGPPIVSKAADIFKPVGLTMAIRPTITNENTVYLKINFTKALPKADGGEDSSTTNTELYVRSGLTAVLSSSYATILTDLDTGVPGLRDIPVLGGLFNNNQKKDNTSDTMLFVTPTILKPL